MIFLTRSAKVKDAVYFCVGSSVVQCIVVRYGGKLVVVHWLCVCSEVWLSGEWCIDSVVTSQWKW